MFKDVKRKESPESLPKRTRVSCRYTQMDHLGVVHGESFGRKQESLCSSKPNCFIVVQVSNLHAQFSSIISSITTDKIHVVDHSYV